MDLIPWKTRTFAQSLPGSLDSAKVVFILNPKAGNLLAPKKWRWIRSALVKRYGNSVQSIPSLFLQKKGSFDDLQELKAKGRSHWVFVGGDGTLNAGLHWFMRLKSEKPEVIQDVEIGAIGTGSSNDAHKPFNREGPQRSKKFPTRLDFSKSVLQDLGKVVVRSDASDLPKTFFFLLNASFGVTAFANQRFNNKKGLIGFLHRLSPSLAILYSAISTLIGHRPVGITVQQDLKSPRRLQINNLSILKKRYFAGNFRYPDEPSLNDHRFGLMICHSMSFLQTLQTLFDLSRGKFEESFHRETHWPSKIKITSPVMIPLELDGEIISGKLFEFSIEPRVIPLCP